jgi:lipopolysaccharide export system permease protein
MPILWRYLLTRYLAILMMGSLAIITLLLTFRFHEIAKFAACGANSWSLLWFVLYQVPYILPAVVPIASLLAAYMLANDLAKSNELMSLRACGLSIRSLMAPLICVSLTLSIVNFYLISEVATYSHMQSRLLEKEFKGINPLVLLKHPDLIRMKGIEITSLGQITPGEGASQLIVAMPHPSSERLLLFFADQINRDGGGINAQGVTLASAIGKREEKFPTLMLDQSKTLDTPQSIFSRIFQGESKKVSADFLPLDLLLHRIGEQWHLGGGRLCQLLSDLFRRFSIALAPFSFTLLGIAFGLRIGRLEMRRNLIFTLTLAAIYLSAFFFAKSFDKRMILSIPLYVVPHLLILFFSTARLKNLSRGVA